MAGLSLNIGKDYEDKYWLCLVDMDTSEVWEVALFLDKTRMQAFTKFMETQGYSSLTLPSEDELNKFFE